MVARMKCPRGWIVKQALAAWIGQSVPSGAGDQLDFLMQDDRRLLVQPARCKSRHSRESLYRKDRQPVSVKALRGDTTAIAKARNEIDGFKVL
jgi:hypothetical protein